MCEGWQSRGLFVSGNWLTGSMCSEIEATKPTHILNAAGLVSWIDASLSFICEHNAADWPPKC